MKFVILDEPSTAKIKLEENECVEDSMLLHIYIFTSEIGFF